MPENAHERDFFAPAPESALRSNGLSAPEPSSARVPVQQRGEGTGSFSLGVELEGRYRLVRRVGSGGMGHVFEAEDRDLGRRVAVKVLREGRRDEAAARRRLAHEARSAACAQHPHIVRIYELGSSRGLDYVVMELLEGEDLQTRIREHGALPIALVESLALALTSALVAMHEAGVIHRDLKPGNIFLANEGSARDVLKVLDFGVAKGVPEVGAAITEAGQILGTLEYMAPEQLRGGKGADAQTDIWSAGAVLYEALTGRPPFEGDGIADLVAKIVSGSPVAVEQRRPEVPAALAAAVRRALSRDPAIRFASARAFQAALTCSVAAQQLSATTQPWQPWQLAQLAVLGPAELHNGVGSAAPPPRTRHVGPVLLMVTLLLLLSCGIRWAVTSSSFTPFEQTRAVRAAHAPRAFGSQQPSLLPITARPAAAQAPRVATSTPP
ncbi:MAG: serine/threonine protein kinase [Myxococcaceae bacterium]|nr:serine/threonine protein kinase [Myxococcaceae bacterium]